MGLTKGFSGVIKPGRQNFDLSHGQPILPAHEGMEDFMPKVKYDKKKVLKFLEQIVERVSDNDENRYKVALDLFLVALDAQDSEYRIQTIVNFLAKEFGVPSPKVAEVDTSSIPF